MPSLAAVDAAYTAAWTIPLSTRGATPSSLDADLVVLVDGISRRTEAARQVYELYAHAATTDAERAEAQARVGDLFDLLATAIIDAAEFSDAAYDPRTRRYAQAVRPVFGDIAGEHYCTAARLYQNAAVLGAERAEEQLEAYGYEFVRCCERVRPRGRP